MAIAAPTAAQIANISRLTDELRSVLSQHQVDYHIQSELGAAEYTTAEMFSVLYTDRDDLTANAPTDLHFGPGQNGYDATSSKRGRVRLQLAFTHCQNLRQHRLEVMTTHDGDVARLKAIADGGQREQGQAAYHQKHGVNPPLDKQGDSLFFGRMYKDMAAGFYNLYPPKKRVGLLDTNLVTKTTKKKDAQGIERTEEEHELINPRTMEDYRHGCEVMMYTTLMITYILPTVAKARITYEQIHDFYDFLLSDEVAGHCANIQQLEKAEMEHWKQVAIKMQQGRNLGDAVTAVKNDALLWTRMIYYQQPNNTTASWPTNLGKGNKGTGQQKGTWNGAKGGKTGGKAGKKGGGKGGKAGGKGKTGGKAGGKTGGKGKDLPRLDPEIINNMAATAPPTARYPAGQPICRNYHISYCPGWCGRAHNICPKKLADGTYCFGNHALRQCTRT